jgi:DNA-binding protein H-NS
MANTSYSQIQKQIEALQAQAAKLRVEEVAGVVAKIKEAIAVYGLTRQDLFGAGSTGATKSKTAGKKFTGVKFADGKGGEWGGRGKRPRWLSEALSSGRSLQDFAVGAARPTEADAAAAAAVFAVKPASGKRGPKRGAKAKAAPRLKYTDGAGQGWSGKGRKPGWFIAGMAAGKSPDDMLSKD